MKEFLNKALTNVLLLKFVAVFFIKDIIQLSSSFSPPEDSFKYSSIMPSSKPRKITELQRAIRAPVARRSYHSNLFKFAIFFPRPATRTITVAGRAKRFIELASAGASRGLASEKNASPAAED